jgi:hypothetical protein
MWVFSHPSHSKSVSLPGSVTRGITVTRVIGLLHWLHTGGGTERGACSSLISWLRQLARAQCLSATGTSIIEPVMIVQRGK